MKKTIIMFLLGLVFVLTGCGRGESGDGGIDGSGQTSISGTAAVGAPIVNTKIFVQGKNGNRSQTSTDALGRFSVDVSRLSPPYIVKTTTPNGAEIFSISHEHGLVNVHPLSDLVTRNVIATRGKNIADIFNNGEELIDPPNTENISASSDAIKRLLSVAYQTFSVNSQFNLIHSEFNADGSGFDSLLDFTQVVISLNKVELTLTDPVSGIESILIDGLELGHDFSVADTQAPSIPPSLTAYASSNSSVKLVWASSSDNVGVAGYKIRRQTDGPTIIATVPMTTFEDSGLTKNKEYCYSIEAFDGAGNSSGESDEVCATTLDNSDVSAPAALSSVIAVPLSFSTIDLDWAASSEIDVIAYRVYRKVGSDKVKLSTVLSPGYKHQLLDANTQYCYEITAVDAANNESPSNGEICATTANKDVLEVDNIPPVTVALPKGGSYDSIKQVQLVCADFGGSGCKATYYTLNGKEPTEFSTRYTGPIVLTANASLKFYSADNDGNAESVNTETYTISIPDPKNRSDYHLEVVHTDADGLVSSSVNGINCGEFCEADFVKDSSIVLTATHSEGLKPLWIGCEPSSENECTAVMDRDRRVLVSFVTQTSESADNDSFATAQLVLDSSIITGYLNTTNDVDFYKIDVTTQGTFKVSSAHPTLNHYLHLYNQQQQPITNTYGTAPVLTQTLSPAVYYVRVAAVGNGVSLDEPYTLKFEGTVMGGMSPDANEENDLFNSAVLVESAGSMQGYLDTINDPDFFKIVVAAQGTFKVSSAHPTHNHYLHLYNEQQQVITNTYGTAPVLTQTLSSGVYYIRVHPVNNGHDLNVPYSLTFAGTVMGETSPDVYEQNDLFSSALLVESAGSVQGYMDTIDDPDFFKIVVDAQGTFKVSSAHPTHNHYLHLYNEQQQAITSTYGMAPVLTQTLSSGVYYIRVHPVNNGHDLNVPYTLTFAGTVMGETSPDANEENDLFSSATAINIGDTINGYLDTVNDPDYFQFSVSTDGSYMLSSAHANERHYIQLYNEAQQLVASTSGTAPQLLRTLTLGNYYVKIIPVNSYDLNVAYSLKIEAQ